MAVAVVTTVGQEVQASFWWMEDSILILKNEEGQRWSSSRWETWGRWRELRIGRTLQMGLSQLLKQRLSGVKE